MKKTIIALFALAGILSAAEEEYTIRVNWNSTEGNFNNPIYGFKLNLSSDKLTDPTTPMSESVVLKSITLLGSYQSGADREIGILVLDQSSTIVGYSDVQTRINGKVDDVKNYIEFNFQGVNQTPLTLSSTTTYDYITVTPDTLGLISSGTNYTYQMSNAAATVSENTITGGSVSVGLRCWHEGAADDCVVYTDVNKSTSTTLAPFINSISLQNIPEPATAALSLLALAGLAARRRRH